MIAETYPAVNVREMYKRHTPFFPPTPPKQTQSSYPSQPNDRPNHMDKQRADQFKISPEEFVRRDKIVRQLNLDTALQYNAGQTVECVTEQAREEYGKLLIRQVFKTYHDFPTAEAMNWPQDDKPYLFTVQPVKNGLTEDGKQRVSPRLVLCTADFFQPVK